MDKKWKEFSFEVNLEKIKKILEIIKNEKNIVIDFEAFDLNFETKDFPLIFGYSKLDFNKEELTFFMEEYKSIFTLDSNKNLKSFWEKELGCWFECNKEKQFIFLDSKLELQIFNKFIGVEKSNIKYIDLYDVLKESINWKIPSTSFHKTKFINFVMEDYKTVIDARKIKEFFSFYLNNIEWKNRERYIAETKEKNLKDLNTMIEILNWLNKLVFN
ncbi:hypothetical protein [Spiroplasma endosymbiont of Dioctria linearis]|uniref:hypothetical protein n=1 Tax=Spiroplasma endosymbiont of Dioctria linearis TaxID=3066290 RepID=UPI00313DE9D1